MEALQNRSFYGKMKCLSFGPAIQVRRGGLCAKHMGLKRGAIGNTRREHIGNTGNILKTHWKQRKKEKRKSPPPPPSLPNPKLKRKKNQRHFECMLNPPIGCMKFLFPKFVTIFGLG
jgi:hypothetical protein